MGQYKGLCREKVPGNVWQFSRVRFKMDEYENHPTQKPESLLERIIKASSHTGDELLTYSRELYGGSKLQNHAFNSRVNGKFKNKRLDHYINQRANGMCVIENRYKTAIEELITINE